MPTPTTIAESANLDKTITLEHAHFLSPHSTYAQARGLFARSREHLGIEAPISRAPRFARGHRGRILARRGLAEMRKINSIHFGPTALLAICLLLVAGGFLSVLGGRIHDPTVDLAARILLWSGLAGCLLLGAVLAIELGQDSGRHRAYRRAIGSPMRIRRGRLECRSCGARQSTTSDTSCAVCGAHFSR